jgi:transposase
VGTVSLDLRRRLVDAYQKKLTKTYEETAAMFGVGEATVSRLLRRKRETGDVKEKPRGGNNPRCIDLEWLKAHAESEPDARLIDRIEAWANVSSRKVSMAAMSNSMRAIGFSHKKRRSTRGSATSRASRLDDKPSR